MKTRHLLRKNNIQNNGKDTPMLLSKGRNGTGAQAGQPHRISKPTEPLLHTRPANKKKWAFPVCQETPIYQ